MSMTLFERVKAYVAHRRHFGEDRTPSWPDLPAITEGQEAALTAAYRAAIQQDVPVTAEELEEAVAQTAPAGSGTVRYLARPTKPRPRP
jgi:hypothetical protein